MQTAIALGTFDGLHEGHRAVLKAVLPFHSAAVTFAIPPKAEMTHNTELLMTPEDKLKALKDFGIDETVMLDFSKIRELSPIQFLDSICERFSPSVISCGYNYRFGKNAEGSTELLAQYCSTHRIDFRCSECVCQDGMPVNSTFLRQTVKEGKVDIANKQIYGGFGFTAPVIHGDARGRTIGFPTVNQLYPKNLVKLKFGVYAVKIIIEDKIYSGIANIGIRPTWRSDEVLSETFILNFSGDIYGKTVTVKPLKFIRPEKVFNSLEELKDTISSDLTGIDNL